MVDQRRSVWAHQSAAIATGSVDSDDVLLDDEPPTPVPPFRSERSILDDGSTTEATGEGAVGPAVIFVDEPEPSPIARLLAWTGSGGVTFRWSSIGGKLLALGMATVLVVVLGQSMSGVTGNEDAGGEASSGGPLSAGTGESDLAGGESDSGRGGSSGAARTTGDIDGDSQTSGSISGRAMLDAAVGGAPNLDAGYQTGAGDGSDADQSTIRPSVAGQGPAVPPAPAGPVVEAPAGPEPTAYAPTSAVPPGSVPPSTPSTAPSSSVSSVPLVDVPPAPMLPDTTPASTRPEPPRPTVPPPSPTSPTVPSPPTTGPPETLPSETRPTRPSPPSTSVDRDRGRSDTPSATAPGQVKKADGEDGRTKKTDQGKKPDKTNKTDQAKNPDHKGGPMPA
jgi:hypothetical protein